MSRSLRATVVAATALTVGLLTLAPAHAAKPEPVALSGHLLGGSANEGVADAVTGADGSTYVAMSLVGGDFAHDPGGHQGGWDVVVAKLAPNGTDVVWATTIGGSDNEEVRAIALGPDGHVAIVGSTSSMDFPTTPGAYKSANTVDDGYVVRLDGTTGDIDWSTLIGGSQVEELLDVAIDADNRIWTVGDTQSDDYPVSQLADGAFQGAAEAVLTGFNPNGTLRYSTMYGGGSWDVFASLGFDAAGDLYALGDMPGWTTAKPSTTLGDTDGDDAAVLRFSMGGPSPVLERATFVGGQGPDHVGTMAVGPTGSLVIAGYTGTGGMPLVHAFQDQLGADDSAYLVKLDRTGQAIVWSTYYGGSSPWIYPMAIRTDAWGATYVSGMSAGTAGQQVHAVQEGNAGKTDGFVAKIAADGRLVFSTYLGGPDTDTVGALALDRTGVRFAGGAQGPDFAGLGTVSGAGDGVIGHLAEVARVTGLKGAARPKDRTPTFRFEVDLVAAHTQCKVDRAAWKPCGKRVDATRFTSTELAPGKHVLRVRALSGPHRVAPIAKRSFRVTGSAS
ncbi:hypothetical protein [Nocardioides sp. SR21]|uniref:hypothetical protein n=1 Tax=Nocardioides sp. SR21 TaxID=2919501 RepID=UPI001FA961E2|nr:hypothetical protein [Nocardioides sp. SR21]